MEENGIKIIYDFFIATVLLALVIASYQWYHEKKRIYMLSIFYWGACLVSVIINVVVENVHSFFYIISALSTYCSQTVLAMVICETRGIKYSTKYLNYLFLFGYLIAEVFRYFNYTYIVYTTIYLFVATFPVLYSLWLVYRFKKNRFTSAQKLFYFFSAILAIHYLDYGFIKIHKELFACASATAFLILHILSTLMPMVVNEYALIIKNNNLEDKIQRRVEDLKNKDLQLWESNKIEILGRFLGLLAHELITPLCAIGITRSSSKRFLTQFPIHKDKILNKIEKIKLILCKIIEITTTLRTASGDLKNENLHPIELKQFFTIEKENIINYCFKNSIKYNLEVPYNPQNIMGKKNELLQIFRTFVLNSMKHINNQTNAWIKITVTKEIENCLLHYSNSGAKNSSQLNHINNDLDILVNKSIMENHKAKVDFDFNNFQHMVHLKFPLTTES